MSEVPSREANIISKAPVEPELAQDAGACGIEGLKLLHDFISPAEEQVVRQCLVLFIVPLTTTFYVACQCVSISSGVA